VRGRLAGVARAARAPGPMIDYMGDEGGVICKLDLGSGSRHHRVRVAARALTPASRRGRCRVAPSIPPSSVHVFDRNAKRDADVVLVRILDHLS